MLLSYKQLKNILKNKFVDNNYLKSFDDINKLLIKITYYHNHLYYSLIIKYLPKDKNLSEIKDIMGKNFCFLFFRFFFMFYILIQYVYKINNDISQAIIKKIFFLYLRYSRKIKYSENKAISIELVNILKDNFDYLYEVFFVQNNIYFHVYFNNLIKYLLPLPFKLNNYSPYLTFRNLVTCFYKKNDIDYLEKIDLVDEYHIKSNKNLDKIDNEIDIHIPIKYFNDNYFDDNFIFILSKEVNKRIYIFIVKSIEVTDNFFLIKRENIMFSREKKNIDFDLYKKGISFEYLNNKWTEGFNQNINGQIDDIIYLSVLKNINPSELFNVFDKINFLIEDYKYLFHNSGLHEPNKDLTVNYLKRPSFFFFTPFSYIEKYFKDRKCIIYKIIANILDILDLTISIISVNPFNSTSNLLINDFDQKKWKYLDLTQIMNYYKNKPINVLFHSNNKCITDEKINIEAFVKKREYCDIGYSYNYVGRRRLQEILFKTRKYGNRRIWISNDHIDYYKKLNLNIDWNALYKNNYHPQENIFDILVYDYDILILKNIGSNGFFFTNYEDNFDSGGEIMIINPQNYLEPDSFFMKTCNEKNNDLIKF